MDFSGMTISGGVSIVPPPPGNKAIFGYGYASGDVAVSITNLVSDTGVVGNDITGVGTARGYLAAAAYG